MGNEEKKRDIKFWIKVYTDIFEDDDIKMILGGKGGTSIFSTWIALLCLAGRINRDGALVDKSGKPLGEGDIVALCAPLKEGVVRMGLRELTRRGMITLEGGLYRVTNWEKYNGNREREMTRERVARHRARKNSLESGDRDDEVLEQLRRLLGEAECNVTDGDKNDKCNGECNGDVTLHGALHSPLQDKEKESSKEKETKEFKEFKDIRSITLSGAGARVYGEAAEALQAQEKDGVGGDDGDCDDSCAYAHACVRDDAGAGACVREEDVSDEDAEFKAERAAFLKEEAEEAAAEALADREEALRELKERYTDKQLNFLRGQLGGGLVMLSRGQIMALLKILSWDEYVKYIGIVEDCERKGHSYKRKSHFKAILDMVERDRRQDLDTTYEMIMVKEE